MDDTALNPIPQTIRAFLLVGAVTAGGLLGGAYFTRVAMAAGSDRYADLDTLAQAMHHIEAQYLGEVTTRELVYGAITGMMNELDYHSVFLSPDEMEAAQVRTEGVYSGVGIELKVLQGNITVVRTIPASPADQTIQPGDILRAVDGQSVSTLRQASEMLQGPAETSVTLELRRKGKNITQLLNRKRLRDRTVRVSAIDNDWAFAEITRFQRNTATDLQQGIEALSPGKGVIIDLRGNAGGLLDEATAVVDLFVREGVIVSTKGPNDVNLEMHQAKAHAPFLGLQTIIVTDGESASASEIVAGAMRTLSGAQLVGSPTYGKWSVQRMYVFEDQSAIKLTVARYHIADKDAGTDLRGLQPDVLVRRETVHQKTLERLRHLTRSVDGAEALVNELAKIDSNEVAHPHLGPLSERLTLDPQLAAAWTLALDNQ